MGVRRVDRRDEGRGGYVQVKHKNSYLKRYPDLNPILETDDVIEGKGSGYLAKRFEVKCQL